MIEDGAGRRRKEEVESDLIVRRMLDTILMVSDLDLDRILMVALLDGGVTRGRCWVALMDSSMKSKRWRSFVGKN